MQHQLRVLAGHNRLEKQSEPPLIQRLIQQTVPGMMIIANTGQRAVIQADPVRITLALRLRQRLIRQTEHGLRRVAIDKWRQPDRGHRSHVRRTGRMQAGHGAVEVLRQLQRFFAHQPWRQHGKLAAPNPCDQVQGFRVSRALSGQLLADSL
ncbi:hypothetical protein D3C87_1374090 [compost metagenome]